MCAGLTLSASCTAMISAPTKSELPPGLIPRLTCFCLGPAFGVARCGDLSTVPYRLRVWYTSSTVQAATVGSLLNLSLCRACTCTCTCTLAHMHIRASTVQNLYKTFALAQLVVVPCLHMHVCTCTLAHMHIRASIVQSLCSGSTCRCAVPAHLSWTHGTATGERSSPLCTPPATPLPGRREAHSCARR